MNTNHPTTPAAPPPRGLTVEDFLTLGAETTAFVKAMEIEGKPAYGIFSAYGEPLGYAETLAVAHATARQNDLEPLSAH